MAQAQKLAHHQLRVPPAKVTAKCACNKVSSLCNKPVRNVMEVAGWSKILAQAVMVMAVLKSTKPYPLRSHQGWMRAIVFA